MSALPPSKRTPFAKINGDVKSIIDTFSPSTYDIVVEVFTEFYGEYEENNQYLYCENIAGAPIPRDQLNTTSFTAEQVRNSEHCIDGYWDTRISIATVMNLQGAPQTLVARCRQFAEDHWEDRMNHILDVTITRDYNTNVEGIDGPMSVCLVPQARRGDWMHYRGVQVYYDPDPDPHFQIDDPHFQIEFYWKIPCPLAFTREWWGQVHAIMRKDASRLLAKIMTQLFSPFLPSAPLNSTNWKLSNATSLDIAFWSDVYERNKNTYENIGIMADMLFHMQDGHGTTAIIQMQNNRSTRLNKNMSVLTEQALKF